MFDFDGVLVDSNAVKRRAYVDVFAAHGVPAAAVEAALAEATHGDRYDVIARVLRRARASNAVAAAEPDEAAVARLADAYNSICEAHTTTCREVAGVSDALPRLAARHALYVVSDTPEGPLRRVVGHRGWAPYFQGVLGRPRTKVQNLESVLRREKVAPAVVVVVGDTRRDLEAARHWGCRFVGIASDASDFEEAGVVILPDVRGLEAALGDAGC